MVYIQIPDGIYPRPVTNFLMISLLGKIGGVSPPTSNKFAYSSPPPTHPPPTEIHLNPTPPHPTPTKSQIILFECCRSTDIVFFNFFQQRLNSRSAQGKILLRACQICNGENRWLCYRLEVRLKTFHQSVILLNNSWSSSFLFIYVIMKRFLTKDFSCGNSKPYCGSWIIKC